MAPSVIILLLEGPALPFQISAVFAILAGIEETLITLISKSTKSDVKSLLHLLRNP